MGLIIIFRSEMKYRTQICEAMNKRLSYITVLWKFIATWIFQRNGFNESITYRKSLYVILKIMFVLEGGSQLKRFMVFNLTICYATGLISDYYKTFIYLLVCSKWSSKEDLLNRRENYFEVCRIHIKKSQVGVIKHLYGILLYNIPKLISSIWQMERYNFDHKNRSY